MFCYKWRNVWNDIILISTYFQPSFTCTSYKIPRNYLRGMILNVQFIHNIRYIYQRGDLNWKNPKNFSFWPKFSRPPPPLLEKGPYQRKCRYFVPNSNYKVRFFETSNIPPPISPESQTSPIFTIEVDPKF